MMMQNYLLMIYVTLDQERAIQDLFRLRDWKYKRKCLENCDSLHEDLNTISDIDTEKIDHSLTDHSNIPRVKPNITVQKKTRCVKLNTKAAKDIKEKEAIDVSNAFDKKAMVGNVNQGSSAVVTSFSKKIDAKKDSIKRLDVNKIDNSNEGDLCEYLLNDKRERNKTNLSKNTSGDKVTKAKSSASVLESKKAPVNSNESKAGFLRRSRRKMIPFKHPKPVNSDFSVLCDTDLITINRSEVKCVKDTNDDLGLINNVQNETAKLSTYKKEVEHSSSLQDGKNLNAILRSQKVNKKTERDPKPENGNNNRIVKGKLNRKTAEEVIDFLKSTEDNFPDDVKNKVQDLLKSFGNKNGIRRLKCIYCTRVFSTRFNYITHIDKHTKKAFDCPECGKKFGNHRNMNAHRFTRANLRKFTCDLCNFETTTACLLRIHNKKEHPASIFFHCHMCPRILKTKSYLNVHLKQAHGIDEGKYECPICGQKCKRPKLFQKHLKEHNNEKGRHCGVCDKVFSSKAHLRSHMRIHAERKHKCTQCGKSFTTITKLKGHERTHSGLKPFPCTFCDYKTAQAGNLKSHMKIHQRDGEFKTGFPKSKMKNPEIKIEEDKGTALKNDIGIPYDLADQQQDWYTSGYGDQNLMYDDTENTVYPANMAYQESKNETVKEKNTQMQKDFYNLDLEQRKDQFNLGYNELESYQNYYNSYVNDNQYYETNGSTFALQDESIIGNTSKQSVSTNENNIKPYTASKLFQMFDKDTSQTLQQQQQHQHLNNQRDILKHSQNQQPVQVQTVITQALYQQDTGSKVKKQELTIKDVQQQQQSHHQQQHFDHQAYRPHLNQQDPYQQDSYNQLYTQPSAQTGVFHPSANTDTNQHQSVYESEIYTGMGKHLNEIRQNLDPAYSTPETETYGIKSGKSDFTNPNDRIYLGPPTAQLQYKYVYDVPQSLQYNKPTIQPEYNLNAQTTYSDLEQTHYAVKTDQTKGS